MTPERWQQVKEMLYAALERTSEQRAAFLDAACQGDHALRGEVEALLASYQRAGSFFETPIIEVAAGLMADEPVGTLAGRSLSHFRVLSLLGAGGMGEVYLAEDTLLARKVALKLLPAHFTIDGVRIRRFQQEARAASSLNHPNIVIVHEIGEVNGSHFIATEFIEGETLRDRLKRGSLKVSEALDMAAQVAAALAAAHGAGIVHRDIKPENVMARPDGLVKVLDFGLAKLTERPASTREVEGDSQAPTMARLSTEPGIVMGTVNYMSPEQARGLKLDHRTDLFSLGVMLYEMVAGRRPFEGETTSDVLAAILTKEPEPLEERGSEIGPELAQAVIRCLAKEREERFQTTGELIAALKAATRRSEQPTLGEAWQSSHSGATRHQLRALISSRPIWVASALVALMIAAVAYWKLLPKAATDSPIRSLAVLPLENLSGDPAQDYFADGMTEALISDLSQVRALRVISRTSVMRYKGSRKSLQEIAGDLDVDAVVEGTVQRDGGRVRITARLIHVSKDALLRSFGYDRELADVLKLQSEVARAIADEIRVQVTAEERARLVAARRVKPEAHEAYMFGHYHLQRLNEEDLRRSIGHFQRAIELDAEYAAAWAGLSTAWLQRGVFGAKSFREVEQPALKAAMKAIELDANSAEAHSSLADLKRRYDLDWAGAEQQFRHAIALDPGFVDAHQYFAHLLSALGRHSEAISEIQFAERLDPFSSAVQSHFGRILYRARNYAEAERRLKLAIELDPRDYGAFHRLGDLYEQVGRYTDAVANLKKGDELQSGSGSRGTSFKDSRLARVYARMGRRDEALRMLKDMERTTEPLRFNKYSAATAWTELGDKDEAFRLLFGAVEERGQLNIYYLNVDPSLDGLHSDPRWKELLRRMNFPEEQHSR
jgi:eukaryotic-like serine/threonine-protein kinase